MPNQDESPIEMQREDSQGFQKLRSPLFVSIYSDSVMISNTADHFRISFSRNETNKPRFDNSIVEEAAVYMSPRQALFTADLIISQIKEWLKENKAGTELLLNIMDNLKVPSEEQ